MPAGLLWWGLGTWYSNINSRRPLEPTKNSPQSGPPLIVTRSIYSLVTKVSENAPSWKQRERRSNYTKGEKNPDDNRTSQNMHTFSWKRTDRQTMVNENCNLASFGRCCWRVCKCWRMLAVNFASDKKKKKETRMTASVLWPEEGDFPENVHRVVYVIIYKRSFESFTCLDLLSDFLFNVHIGLGLLYSRRASCPWYKQKQYAPPPPLLPQNKKCPQKNRPVSTDLTQ